MVRGRKGCFFILCLSGHFTWIEISFPHHGLVSKPLALPHLAQPPCTREHLYPPISFHSPDIYCCSLNFPSGDTEIQDWPGGQRSETATTEKYLNGMWMTQEIEISFEVKGKSFILLQWLGLKWRNYLPHSPFLPSNTTFQNLNCLSPVFNCLKITKAAFALKKRKYAW